MREFEGIQNHDGSQQFSDKDLQSAIRERELQRDFQAHQDRRYGSSPAGYADTGSVSSGSAKKVLLGTDANDFFGASQAFGRGKNRPKTRRVGDLTREDMTRKS